MVGIFNANAAEALECVRFVVKSNLALFRRDDFTCPHYGSPPGLRLFTRDHVFPLSRGDSNRRENVETACRACKQRKDDQSLDALDWTLLARPYVPTRAKRLVLANRKIPADQM